jgi:hypothetical protein
VIRYDPGAGIGWHKDRPLFEHVVGISLGAPAALRLRRRRPGGFDRASAPLARRSIYHLSGEARHEWEHSIAEMDVARWSITFRTFSEKGLIAREAARPSDIERGVGFGAGAAGEPVDLSSGDRRTQGAFRKLNSDRENPSP